MSNILRSGRRQMEQADCKQISTSAAEAISAYYDLAREVFQSFTVNAVHRKGFDESSLGMMETHGKQKVQSSEGRPCGEKPVGGNQVQHYYSLICVSPPSTSDVHSKRHSTFYLRGKDFLLDLSFGSFTSFIICFLSLCFNFSHNAGDPMWYEISLWVLVNAADIYSCSIRRTAFKSKFPVPYNYSHLNKGLQHFYSAAPFYTKWGLLPLDTAFSALLRKQLH